MIDRLITFHKNHLTFARVVSAKMGFWPWLLFIILLIVGQAAIVGSFFNLADRQIYRALVFGGSGILLDVLAVVIARYFQAKTIQKLKLSIRTCRVRFLWYWDHEQWQQYQLNTLVVYLETEGVTPSDKEKLEKIIKLLKDKADSSRFSALIGKGILGVLFTPVWVVFNTKIFSYASFPEIVVLTGFVV